MELPVHLIIRLSTWYKWMTGSALYAAFVFLNIIQHLMTGPPCCRNTDLLLYHPLSYSQHLTPRRTCTKRYAFKLFPERNLFFGAKIADAFPNVMFTTDQCCTQQRSQSCCNAVLSYVAFQSNALGTKMSWHMWI